MIIYKCKRCGKSYDKRDCLYQDECADPDWDASDGRCFDCYVKVVCYAIFGGYLEPVFKIGDMTYMQDGVYTKEEMSGTKDMPPDSEIPF